ncbi:NHL repeat [Cinnamomum micranthum f. kanehirae]|uniref:NHL repeat n=1 Tax=Cinnamomum micranthum f. kanehirae TaxID=337451 RepID=A0A443PEJ7_9MAGN|nr:NHL repeat [Cinnamomum micranthum f. kanehirae]
MKKSLLVLPFFIAILLQLTAEAAPSGALTKHLSSFLKWTRASPKTPQIDGNVLQFENGYLVETVVERGNHLGVEPYSIRVSPEGELFAVDAINNNIVKITPPLSQYSRARLVAGSFQGYSGHVDGKPSDARFNHPKGVTIDDQGNVYVADTSNFAIRKIGDAGVTTIAGGKSNVAGYRDGPSEDAKFSSDFDVVYVPRTCSLLVVDRGNAALRQISLQQEDCDDQYSSISASDIVMVIGAVLAGYASCVLQQGFGSSFFSKKKQVSETEFQDEPIVEKPILIVETIKEDPDAGWPSFGRLITDLFKLAFEALGNIFLYLIPLSLRPQRFKRGLTPLKDYLVMPEDKSEPSSVQKQRSPSPLTETLHAPNTSSKSHAQQKPPKTKHSLKDPSLSGKHRSSKRQDFSEFYGSGDAPQYGQLSSKSQKDRTRHRHRDKSGEVVFGAAGVEPKPVELKSGDYADPKFDHYNFRNKFGTDDHYHF